MTLLHVTSRCGLKPNPRGEETSFLHFGTETQENITSKFVVRGVDKILAWITRAHDEWVASKGYVFQPAGNSDSHHTLIRFLWQMVPREGGPAAAKGLDIFVLTKDNRIQSLYQFNEPLSP